MTTVALTKLDRSDRVAFGWGFGEAVLFFVIPDVFLTLMAIRFVFRRSVRLAMIATMGAVMGGLVIYGWAALHPTSVFAAMELLPGIDSSMVDVVRSDVARSGNVALLAGPWQGRPYKLFAAASGELGLSPFGLALLTIPGRLVRFIVAVSVASYLRWFFARWVRERAMIAAWAGFWLLGYAGYWLA